MQELPSQVLSQYMAEYKEIAKILRDDSELPENFKQVAETLGIEETENIMDSGKNVQAAMCNS